MAAMDPDPNTMSASELADVLASALTHAGCPDDAFERKALASLVARASRAEGDAWLTTFLRAQDAFVAPAAALHQEAVVPDPKYTERRLELDCLSVTQGLDAVFTHTPLALSDLQAEDHPPASPYRCYYCGDMFDVAPWFIYESRDPNSGAWRVRGNYCSVGCMMRGVSECGMPGKRDTWAMNCAVMAHQRLRLPVSRPVPVAPDRRTREDYGGVISVAEWRRLAGYGMAVPEHDTLVHYATGPFIYGRAAAVKEETRGGSELADCNNILKWMASTTRVRTVDPTPGIHRMSTRAVPPEDAAPELVIPRQPLQQEVAGAQSALLALHFPEEAVRQLAPATQCALVTHLSDAHHGDRGQPAARLLQAWDAEFVGAPRLVRERAHQVLRDIARMPAAIGGGGGDDPACSAIDEFPSHRNIECILDEVVKEDGHLIREAAAAVAAARRAGGEGEGAAGLSHGGSAAAPLGSGDPSVSASASAPTSASAPSALDSFFS